jgi:hypothetical protein
MNYIVSYRRKRGRLRTDPIVAESFDQALEIGQKIAGDDFLGVFREDLSQDGGENQFSDRHHNGISVWSRE